MVSLKKKNNSVPELFCDGNKNFSRAKEIAERFNEFFVNVDPNLANLIPESDKTFNQLFNDPVNEKFLFANLTPEMVLESVNKLQTKNSAGKDNISTKLLKDIIICIVYYIHCFPFVYSLV